MFETRLKLQRVIQSLSLDQIIPDRLRVAHNIQMTYDVLSAMDKPIGLTATVTVNGVGETTLYEVAADCKFEYFVQLWSLASQGTSNAMDTIYLYRYRDWDGSGFPPSVRIYSQMGLKLVQVSNCRGRDIDDTGSLTSTYNHTPQFTLVPGDKLTMNISDYTSAQAWIFSMMVLARKIKY